MSQITAQGYVAILQGIGAPVTPDNIAALLGWQRAEGGSASFNPFNTTLMAPGATSYNSVGVRNYTSLAQGVQATVDTLKGSAYAGVVAALRKGNNAGAVADAVGASPWGTPNFRADIPSGGALAQDLRAIGATGKLSGINGSSLLHGLGSAAGDVAGAAGSVASKIPGVGAAENAASALGDLTDPSWWAGMLLRLGFMVLGLVLITIGLVRLFGGNLQRGLEAGQARQLADLEAAGGGLAGDVPAVAA